MVSVQCIILTGENRICNIEVTDSNLGRGEISSDLGH